MDHNLVGNLQLTPRISLRFVQTTLEQDQVFKGEYGAHLTLVMMQEGAGHFMLNQQNLQHYRPHSFWLSCAQGPCSGYDFFPRHHFYHLLMIEFSAEQIAQVAACGLVAPDEDAWVLSATLSDEMSRQMQRMQQGLHDRSPVGLLHLESMALEALWLALSQLQQQQQALNIAPVTRVYHRERRRLIAARDYIRQHAAQPLTIEDLALHAGLSQMALKRGFRAMFGVTPWNYVIECRLREAQRLLESSPLPLNDIALRCGFAHASHMTRFFQRQFGQTPGRYRSTCEQSLSAD
ncbi:AraC family transcriptional regulator [Erwiniaceae bacterium BAC15a-03b]|uniref:AraC family transcriptional regulator n=1 Tax=Winslowiella arboricola TaxID=2978220 RepID=A0A9J6PXS9_9GAMM|nr:AraC family transcriptional regulator [Winslowiella arboricola]MCU5775506.1 AraC family transcriptional regulator [Winslowiella arboricola]MCU5779644.1 AraC family transcriptional regulator [Winslowiella arboricola]